MGARRKRKGGGDVGAGVWRAGKDDLQHGERDCGAEEAREDRRRGGGAAGAVLGAGVDDDERGDGDDDDDDGDGDDDRGRVVRFVYSYLRCATEDK